MLSFPSRERIRDIFGKTFHLPHAHRFENLLRGLSPSDKVIFAVLATLFAGSAFWMLSVINAGLMTQTPVRGGTLTEGIVGSVRFINPLLAISDADKDLTTLVYSGLMKKNADGTLISDLAAQYEISDDGLTYTFVLRDDAVFHDGTQVTADDVVFTIRRAQDPTLKSPKLANWDGVDVEAVDAKTVRFTLKQPYAPFIENTTLGILPSRLWSGVTVEEMPFSNLNIDPVGTGPFEVSKVKENSSGIPTEFTLLPFDRSTRGSPYLARITVHLYPSDEAALTALEKSEIDALHSVNPAASTSIGSGHTVHEAVLSRVFAIFFNQNKNDALADIHVRTALDTAINKSELVENVLQGYGRIIDGPVPPNP